MMETMQILAQQQAQLDAQDKEMAPPAQDFKALGSKAGFGGYTCNDNLGRILYPSLPAAPYCAGPAGY